MDKSQFLDQSFDKDPFFKGHNKQMKGFTNLNLLPFRLSSPFALYENGCDKLRPHQDHQHSAPWYDCDKSMISPFFHEDLKAHFNSVIKRMNTLAGQVLSSDINGCPNSTYSSSSVYRYEQQGEQEPRIYEAHRSRQTAPGGVREEKKALRDTTRKLEKYSVGRHINERGHVLETTTYTDSNEMRQNEHLYGMSESDMDKFKADWEAAISDFKKWPSVISGQVGRPAVKESKKVAF